MRSLHSVSQRRKQQPQYAHHKARATFLGRLRLKCDGTRAVTIFRLSAKRTSPFKSAVQSTTGSRGVCISGSNAGYPMFRGSVKSTGYPLRSPISPSLPLLSVTVCHHISTGLYYIPHMVPNQEEFYEHIYVRFSDFVFAAIASIEVLTDIFFLFCIIRLCEAR